MTLGNRIKELRKNKKIAQEYLADMLGVSRQAVSKWENDISFPDTENLIKLSELLGVSVGYLTIRDTKEISNYTMKMNTANVLNKLSIVFFLIALFAYLYGLISGEFTCNLIPVFPYLTHEQFLSLSFYQKCNLHKLLPFAPLYILPFFP